MKRNFNCSDSLTHFLSHPLEGEMKGEEECIYKAEMISRGDGEDYGVEETETEIETETGQFGEKKRRLSNHQVKSLEKIFEVDNKLDPDRKIKVAHDLGLQPRQVAIWFQNRRARWKTKQLERDYNLLKSNYDLLKHNYHKLEQEKQSLTKQLEELKSKVHEETEEEYDDDYDDDESKYNRYDNNNGVYSGSDPTNTNHTNEKSSRDGFSDSDSSGVLNDENMNLSNNHFGVISAAAANPTIYQQESDPYNGEDESCNIFLVDQAPNLCWYFRDHLN